MEWNWLQSCFMLTVLLGIAFAKRWGRFKGKHYIHNGAFFVDFIIFRLMRLVALAMITGFRKYCLCGFYQFNEYIRIISHQC